MSSVVETDLVGGVLTVTLADEENRNALGGRLVAELSDALDEAEADDGVRVVVLTNSGRVFCAGANLSERSGRSGGAKRSRVVDPAELFSRFQKSRKPYVGRIAGHCVAGGMGLAAAMDVSIAIDTAKMGFTEVRIGVAPAMISVLCLPKMQASDARAAFLRGNRFLAPEAARMGLINAAVPVEELDAEVDAVVQDLLAGGPAALAANKELLLQVPQMSIDDAFAWTAKLSADLFKGEEAKEGMAAFLEKRSASWIPSDAPGTGSDVDFDFPPDDDPRRVAVREWRAANPEPTQQDLHDAGYVVPHWPEPWGIDADPVHQIIIAEELRGLRVRRHDNQGVTGSNAIGIGWAAPTILLAGTEEQKRRYLPKIFNHEEIWCQLFSEPDAGSDLASLATRAERDGDEYVINGSKIWSSGAHASQMGILIARTDPDVPKHKGISYFICPMDTPGLSMSPIVDMTTAHSFNQVFFNDMRLHESMRIGDEGDGWRLAKVTLANERVQLSSAGSLWGAGPSAEMLLDLVRAGGGEPDPVRRQQLARLHCNAEVLRLNRLRTLSAQLTGRTPGTEASIQKLMADEHGQEVMELAKELVGAAGMLDGSGPAGDIPAGMRQGATEINFGRGEKSQFPESDPVWHYGYLFAPALTLGGGTWAVQRNIIGEHVLGLPREPNVEKGQTWAQTRGSRPE